MFTDISITSACEEYGPKPSSLSSPAGPPTAKIHRMPRDRLPLCDVRLFILFNFISSNSHSLSPFQSLIAPTNDFPSGLIHNLDSLLYGTSPLYPSYLGWLLSHWNTTNFAHWPSDTTADIQPINCVSHNDFWRSVPLYTAIAAGCIGVEADVWSFDNEKEIFVGHKRWTLTRKRTLQDLYIGPLLGFLTRQNRLRGKDATVEVEQGFNSDANVDWNLHGIFDTDPSQTFILLIDLKTSGRQLWDDLNEQLSPLREKGYLTHFNGTGLVSRPVTVVASGNAPFDILNANQTFRDVFFDAPLEEIADLSHSWPNPNLEMDPSRCRQGETRWRPGCRLFKDTAFLREDESSPAASHLASVYDSDTNAPLGPSLVGPGVAESQYNWMNSYYASASFTRSVGRIKGSRLSQAQLQLIRGQIKGAHQKGLKVRYWGLPQWPRALRNHVWHILVREGVDLISADDLNAASEGIWTREK